MRSNDFVASGVRDNPDLGFPVIWTFGGPRLTHAGVDSTTGHHYGSLNLKMEARSPDASFSTPSRGTLSRGRSVEVEAWEKFSEINDTPTP